jgi:hypothetical protein
MLNGMEGNDFVKVSMKQKNLECSRLCMEVISNWRATDPGD